jgi:ERCC4-type nuclease
MSIINGEKEQGELSQKWTLEVLNQRTKILGELPGIGPKTAERIMSEAKDIMGLCTMSEYELTQIEGVSSIQAKDLFKFLHG